MWSHLRLTVLHVEYRAERRCRLPAYKGSMLRGSLGHALRDMACFEPGGPCGRCPNTDRCAAGALFEPQEAGEVAARFDRPMPYIVTAPPDRREAYAAGEGLAFTLSLVGSGRVWLPWVVGALASMGQRGLGAERAPFVLSRVCVEAPAGQRTPLDLPGRGVGPGVGELDGASLVAAQPPSERVVLHFVTPTDLRRKGHQAEQLDGALLVSRLLRRLGGLLQTYCRWSADGFDFKAVVDEASGMACRDLSLEFREWERYSVRRGGRHRLSGLVGRVELGSVPARLWPYLVVGERTHVGKGASFGMGQYVLEAPQA
ncbi:MAG: CRISPR system precrRNA processing endoribonuclease RAMP protein Cas6 [Isosphaeraceae bacterium]|nr:CRISPR system precrRNA processing endoribonuclease RAMP protein Cas6 [Isosphaeraceae bacterium]